jgi:hypothetical protein
LSGAYTYSTSPPPSPPLRAGSILSGILAPLRTFLYDVLVAEDHPTNDNLSDRVTIREAATLLGVHPNTVRNRIKDGTYKAEKIITNSGPTWLIERDSLANNLPTNTPTRGSQQLVSMVDTVDLERVLTELVRAVEKDPERENRLEAVKLRVQTLRTQVVVSVALLAAFGAIVSWLETPQAPELIFAAFGTLIASAGFAFIYMHHLASTIARNIERPRDRGTRAFEFAYYVLSLGGLAFALTLFLLFFIENTP